MGCQSTVVLENNLTFSINTHDPDTGVLTDADSNPTYRIYEDETSTPILTGNMAKLDDANTTGFYTELIACTAVNGFEDGKSYTINIEATVDGDTGGIAYNFTAETAVWSVATRTLTQSAGSVAAAVSGTSITVKRGDSWSISLTGLGSLAGRSKLWVTVKRRKDHPDTSAIFQIEETDNLLFINEAAAATAANGTLTVDDETAGDITIALDEIETAKLSVYSNISYDVQMLNSGTISTVTEGLFNITADVTRATS